jgi:hypothetical protein
MDKPKPLSGWKAGGPAKVPLDLTAHTPTSPPRQLRGLEFEEAKRRLLERTPQNRSNPK